MLRNSSTSPAARLRAQTRRMGQRTAIAMSGAASRAHVCAHGFLVEGGARKCVQARNADVAATCLDLCLGMSVFRSYKYLLKQKTEKP